MTPHTVVLTAALAALLGLPCAVFAMRARADGLAFRKAWLRRARLDRPRLHLLDKALTHRGRILGRGLGFEPAATIDGVCCCDFVIDSDRLPGIEQVVAELRRLNRQRLGGLASASEMWAAAVVRAYDRWLQVACHYQAVSHHLLCLTDLDRDIERVRIEAELTAAGLAIRG